jgi:regulator of replication initiation timing
MADFDPAESLQARDRRRAERLIETIRPKIEKPLLNQIDRLKQRVEDLIQERKALVAEVTLLRAELEAAHLARIEAQNPGIDITKIHHTGPRDGR